MDTSAATTTSASASIPTNPHITQIDSSNRPSQPRSSSAPRNRRNGPRRNNNPPAGEGGRTPNNPPLNPGENGTSRPPRPRNPRNRPPRPRTQDNAPEPSEPASGSTTDVTRSNDSRPISRNSNPTSSGSKPRNRRRPPKSNTEGDSQTLQAPMEGASILKKPQGRGSNRRANFGARLTEPDSQTPPSQSSSSAKIPSERPQSKKRDGPIADDLTSRLIHSLSTPPYPDCPICFNAIRWDHATWSCSPSLPTLVGDGENSQYCWTVFHLKCIKSWALKSVKDVADAWRARGEQKNGEWRCPGCQGKREVVPSVYWCFCSAKAEPKPPRLATPHSCGGPCTRPRESGCGHPCPLSCHPGPCPPCKVTTRLECSCPRKNVIAFKCGGEAHAKRDISCGQVCNRMLNCGKHSCDKICHKGSCGPCQVVEEARCWCGKSSKEMFCSDGEPIDCHVDGQAPWIGRYACTSRCDRFFDCGIHKCQKPCHPPSATPAHCPFSPDNITRCPCGKSTIAPSPNSDPSAYDFPARTSCTLPIPTCASTCSKPHPGCEHPCVAKCHTGPCPPCNVEIMRPCRCGATTRSIKCYEVHEENGEQQEILCNRPCHALRACGKHECRRICCPLASLAASSKKGKKNVASEPGIGEERGGLHECDLVCGKPLTCGNHQCEERDHRGLCPPCLRSSFEEMVCFCGRTVYEPPIPCGTKMQCHYPCPRQPACGHPRTTHTCHDESISCPPCPVLIAKQCACGKKMVPHTKCSLERDKVSCGTVCGKLLSCGFHHCQRTCHGNDCGPCSAPCGKSRKLCLPNNHPCTKACHAPAACPETEPCQSVIVLTCACGRIRQSVCCGRSVNSSGAKEQSSPKCTSECAVAKRNARLADALGINPDGRDKASVTYNDELVAFARENPRFIPMVEKAFADFTTSGKRTEVLPHMPPDRRKFVHDLARLYRIDTQLIDQEPHRSVQLLRRLDSRIPSPLLSAYVASLAPTPSLGRLTDLRSLKSASSSWRAPGTSSSSNRPTPSPSPAAHGWGPVPVNTPSPVASAQVTRTSTPSAGHSQPHRAPPPPVPAAPVSTDEPVPENWEDDV